MYVCGTCLIGQLVGLAAFCVSSGPSVAWGLALAAAANAFAVWCATFAVDVDIQALARPVSVTLSFGDETSPIPGTIRAANIEFGTLLTHINLGLEELGSERRVGAAELRTALGGTQLSLAMTGRLSEIRLKLSN